MKTLSPERELELEIEYHYIKKRKKRTRRDQEFLELWEAYRVLRTHGRDQKKWENI